MPSKQFRRWFEDDDRYVLELLQSGMTAREIARLIGRSELSVRSRLLILRKRETTAQKSAAA